MTDPLSTSSHIIKPYTKWSPMDIIDDNFQETKNLVMMLCGHPGGLAEWKKFVQPMKGQSINFTAYNIPSHLKNEAYILFGHTQTQ